MSRYGGYDNDYDDIFSSNDLEEYDSYGKTPPRTRILRKNKERKHRESIGHPVHHHGTAKPSPRMVRPGKKPISRRNTVSVMFDELIANAESLDTTDQGKRSDKRTMKLQRGSERDLKLDIARAQTLNTNDVKEIDTLPPMTPQPSMHVESSKHFKSLCSKRVLCTRRQVRSVSGNFGNFVNCADLQQISECPTSRVEFHKTLSMLIRMGSNDNKQMDRNCRRNLSREEHMWQNEVKDLIWLELQAWHANRSLTDEDNYLCLARDAVGNLLNEIMLYRFRKHKKRVSAHSIDSGVGTEDCSGCLSLACFICRDAQTDALREIEELLCRLESAESLFPSSRAFSECYPLYDSDEFVGRVKTMCLWYNMTRHLTLKLSQMAKFFKYFEMKFQSLMSSEGYNAGETSSPSDSNSSSSSIGEFIAETPPIDTFASFLPLTDSVKTNSPYRKYIETMLKTRGLGKTTKFIDKMHHDILFKVHLTLERPVDDSFFQKKPDCNDEDQLRRYGAWSPEAQSLNLPSYKSGFVYLSGLPLKMLHEFLLMRLEQKPKNPSPLSVRQLMRELKEGLKICTKHRETIIDNFHVALTDCGDSKQLYVEALDTFDRTLLLVFEDYLEYLQTWALLQHDNFQKNLLEEEWKFIYEIVPSIIGGRKAAIKKLTYIIGTLLESISQRVMDHIDDIAQEVKEEGGTISKSLLFSACRDLQALFNDEREMISKTIQFSKIVIKGMKTHVNPELLKEFRDHYLQVRCLILTAIEKTENICDHMLSTDNLDDFEKSTLTSRCREILLQGFRFGFEFHKEMVEFIPEQGRKKLSRNMVQFAHLWMKFTQERCERGRGKRPRWANQGLEFLLTVCEPQNTMHLTEEEFEDLKRSMDLCISHVIGSSGPLTPESALLTASPKLSVDIVRPFSRSRGASPSPRPTYKSQRSNSRKPRLDHSAPTPSSESGESSPQFQKKYESLQDGLLKVKSQSARRSERILQAVCKLDAVIDNRLRDAELIGQVVNSKDFMTKAHIRRRHVTFSWQRGIKIGQGRFGKVYTAVNNNTGEMMAVKEIAIQPNDALTIRKVSEELKILEGINHKNIIKYYGLEVQKEEMLIFMEFCSEGTLESLVAATENGLPEILIRRYTYQLVCGVAELHKHGVVHRDIKTANIFLSDEGNCLKIGDFGCAVKIKSHATMPGELQGFVGTQAYMAPEMFMKTQSDGHGRAADIWSVGCVTVEMATGKRPWAEFDSNYQIMFKVGMGDRPEAPDTLIDEGHDFLDRCLQHNARDRATAVELLHHPFVKVGYD